MSVKTFPFSLRYNSKAISIILVKLFSLSSAVVSLCAQIHPEMHRGLMVRVAGYMVYFIELDKSAQDTIICRTPHYAKAN